MVIVKLCGGLGNQLFQYSYGYYLAKKNNADLWLDLSWFGEQSERKPDILQLNINYDKLVYFWKENGLVRFLNKKYINRGLRIMGLNMYRLPQILYLKESRYRFNRKMNCLDLKGKNVYVDGYWQCPRYFQEYYSDLCKLFSIKNLSDEIVTLGEKLKKDCCVAIHIRRGDYPKKKKIGIRLRAIGDEYYRNVLEKITNEYPNSELYLFSNDMEDAKVLIKSITNKKPRILAEEKKLNVMEEWYLMSCCRIMVIGNSTFSWWAAYLNSSIEKNIYAPMRYWGNDDICPNEWNQYPV